MLRKSSTVAMNDGEAGTEIEHSVQWEMEKPWHENKELMQDHCVGEGRSEGGSVCSVDRWVSKVLADGVSPKDGS